MNKYIKYTLFMAIIGIIVGSTLSVVSELTVPIIEKQKLQKVEKILLNVDAENKWIIGGENIDISDDEYIEEVYLSVDEKENIINIGYLVNTKGYSNGNIETMIFIDNNKKTIKQVEILSIENQTKGVGSLIVDDVNYIKVFENIKVSKYVNDNINNHTSDDVDIISGATISSRAVVQAVISACNNFNNIKK